MLRLGGKVGMTEAGLLAPAFPDSKYNPEPVPAIAHEDASTESTLVVKALAATDLWQAGLVMCPRYD
jgi:hypothetical protein